MSLLSGFADIVGSGHVLTDPELVASHTTDWTGRFVGSTEAVVRPGSSAEVAAVIGLCRQAGRPLTLQGGNTGLVGGGVPLHDEVVLSLNRLHELGRVDDLSGQVTAGAGVTLGELQRAAMAAGWSYGVDLGARETATVGGMVATNAGGTRVLRYGHTKAQLLGVEAVTGKGEVVSHLGGLLKDNTGYDLAGLLCGSEGTLAVVTRARLRLVPPTDERVVALLAFDVVADAVRAASALRRTLPSLDAAEFFLASGLALVCRSSGAVDPFARPRAAYLLVEAADQVDPTDVLAEAVDALEQVDDVVVAQDPVRAGALWQLREGHSTSINTVGIPHKLDVTLPLANLAEFIEIVPETVRRVAPQALVWLFGHAADGNVHVNVTGIAPDDESVDDAVLALVASFGGSISAEHGIGVAKRRWLSLCRSDAELAVFGALKKAMDPDAVLNPQVLLG